MSDENEDLLKKAKAFIQGADKGCRKCKNFGSSACPSFNDAVEKQGVDADALSDEIKKDQKGQTLIPCKNVPSKP